MPPPLDSPAKPPSRRGTLRWRLAWVGALLIALSVALTVGLSLSSAGMHGEALATDLSLAQTRKLARIVSGRLVQRQIALRALSEAHPAASWRSMSPATARAVLAEANEPNSHFDSLLIVQPDGELLAMRDADGVHSPAVSLADRYYFQATLAQRRSLVSEPVVGRVSREPIVVFTQPVLDESGRLVVVLAGVMQLARNHSLEAIVLDEDEDPSRIVIVDAQGRIIAHSDASWLMRDAAEEPALAAPMARWRAMQRPIDPGGVTLNGRGRLVSAVGIPVAEWLLIQSLPEDTVLGGVRAGRTRAIWLGAMVAALGGLTLLLITRRLLKPLRQLEDVARWIGLKQSPPNDAWPASRGEIGALARVLREAVEQRAAADAEGQRRLLLLQAVMSRSPVGLAFTRDGHFEKVNGPFEALLGYPRGSLQGQSTRIIAASQSEYEALGPKVDARFAQQEAYDEELRLMRHDGTLFWGRIQGAPVDWADPQSGSIWVLENVDERRAEREGLTWQSTHDALTELTNRAEFLRRLGSALADRRHQELATLFIDLDRFKAVNDSGGHAAGDAMLVAVARAIEVHVRSGDTVARLGGDEFAVLLNNCHAHATLQVAEKIRQAIEHLRLPWGDQVYTVGASIGAAQADDSLPDADALMAAADAACYDAKHSGRNAVRLHQAAKLRVV